jgi:hypothetical protein
MGQAVVETAGLGELWPGLLAAAVICISAHQVHTTGRQPSCLSFHNQLQGSNSLAHAARPPHLAKGPTSATAASRCCCCAGGDARLDLTPAEGLGWCRASPAGKEGPGSGVTASPCIGPHGNAADVMFG